MNPFGRVVDFYMGTVAAPECEAEEEGDGWYQLTTAVIGAAALITLFLVP